MALSNFLANPIGSVGTYFTNLLMKQKPPVPKTTPTMPSIQTMASSTPSGVVNTPQAPVMPAVSAPKQSVPAVSTPKAPVTPAVQNPVAPTAPTPPVVQNAPVAPVVPQEQAPQAPPAPTVSPETKAAYDAAQKVYEASLSLSPEELSTQEDLDKVIESFKSGYENIEGQAIPMQFITGQQAALERIANIKAEPLERKLARLQAARTASTEASKFALERTEKRLSAEETGAQKAAESAESARRFGIEQAGSAETRALASKKAEQDYKLSVEKFNEDKRQFGLNYANEQRKIAIDEAKLAGETPSGIDPQAGAALQLVNEILPKVNEIAGVIRTGFATGTKDKLSTLVSNLSVNARKLIKGSGAVSDFEAKTLADSTNSLSAGYFSGRLSEDFIENELKKIRGVINSNAGLNVRVKVINPTTNEAKEGELGRQDIFDAASQGFIIQYQ